MAVPLPVHTVCRHDLRQTTPRPSLTPFVHLPSFQNPATRSSISSQQRPRETRSKVDIVRLITPRLSRNPSPTFYRRPRASPKQPECRSSVPDDYCLSIRRLRDDLRSCHLKHHPSVVARATAASKRNRYIRGFAPVEPSHFHLQPPSYFLLSSVCLRSPPDSPGESPKAHIHHVGSLRARAPKQCAPGRAVGQGVSAARRHD